MQTQDEFLSQYPEDAKYRDIAAKNDTNSFERQNLVGPRLPQKQNEKPPVGACALVALVAVAYVFL